MKATEVMYGDLVADQFGTAMVVGFDARDERIMLYRNGCVITTSIGEITPIPLTAEILDKNGFIHSPNKWDLENEDKFYPYEIHLGDEGHFIYYEIRTYDVFIQNKMCDYVHELQRALRLCGLTKLADNFKVE